VLATPEQTQADSLPEGISKAMTEWGGTMPERRRGFDRRRSCQRALAPPGTGTRGTSGVGVQAAVAGLVGVNYLATLDAMSPSQRRQLWAATLEPQIRTNA